MNYVVEMFCDRIAACQIYQGEKYTDASPWEYYDRSRDHYLIHPNTAALLEKLLLMLRGRGGGADPGLHPPGVGGPGRGLILTMGPSVG